MSLTDHSVGLFLLQVVHCRFDITYASGLSEHGGKINNNGTLLACLNSYSLCSWPLRNQLPQPQSSQELETVDLNTTSCQEQAITGFSKLNFRTSLELRDTPRSG
jgi:hypothetical protein